MHVAECLLYDGTFTADDLVAMIAARVHLLPRYRQKIVPTPLRLAHPTWEDDPDFSVANHVDELELTKPGDARTLSRMGGLLFSELLDRTRPLWKATVLHGHESGGTVVFLKLHHSMVDGVSSIDLLEVLHGTSPDATLPPPPVDWKPRPMPGRASLLRDAVSEQATGAVGAVRGLAGAIRRPNVGTHARRLQVLAKTTIEAAPSALRRRPETPFNQPITAAREFAWLEVPFDDVTAARRPHDSTVNDFVLATLSGGLRRYMVRHGFEVDGVKLRVMCPVSMRRADEHGDLGNLVSMVVVTIDLSIEDPVERLTAVRDEMRRLKSVDQAGGMYDLAAIVKALPAPLFAIPWRHMPRGYWPHNITSTNVAGPREPLFLGEHELRHWYPFGVQWNDNGLFLCTLSYRGRLCLGLVSDPTVVEDVWQVNDDLKAAYEELLARRPSSRTKRAVKAEKKA